MGKGGGRCMIVLVDIGEGLRGRRCGEKEVCEWLVRKA